MEINVDDVCDSMAAGDDGVEVQTIMQGQAPLPGQNDDLDFMVQEEVETTTDGDTLTVELDPVDNVIIALQNTESVKAGSHLEEDGDQSPDYIGPSTSGRKRRLNVKGGSKGMGNGKKNKNRKSKRGATRFVNRTIPFVLSTSSAIKEAKEANEASFDPEKRPRRWRKRKVPVNVLGGEFTVSLWSTGTCG